MAEAGSVITPFYDSLMVKVTASGRDFNIALQRMDRALREFRIRGVKTNIPFLENVISHPRFLEGKCVTTFIDETPELFTFLVRADRATRLLEFIGEITVNGNALATWREIESCTVKMLVNCSSNVPAHSEAPSRTRSNCTVMRIRLSAR